MTRRLKKTEIAGQNQHGVQPKRQTGQTAEWGIPRLKWLKLGGTVKSDRLRKQWKTSVWGRKYMPTSSHSLLFQCMHSFIELWPSPCSVYPTVLRHALPNRDSVTDKCWSSITATQPLTFPHSLLSFLPQILIQCVQTTMQYIFYVSII